MTPGASQGWAHFPALHDALDSATSAALAAETGDRRQVEMALLEASAAAASAFPACSSQAEALNVIFTAIASTESTLDAHRDFAPPSPPLVEPELGD